MTAYPDGNPGMYPLDPASEVGQFRLLFGDTQSTPYDPVQPGIQNYEELSDDEITSYLTAGSGSDARAISLYYGRLAADAAKIAKSIKDYDLAIDTTKRATQLLDLAKWWAEVADREEGDDGLFISSTGRTCTPIAELTRPIYGRKYVVGRIC